MILIFSVNITEISMILIAQSVIVVLYLIFRLRQEKEQLLEVLNIKNKEHHSTIVKLHQQHQATIHKVVRMDEWMVEWMDDKDKWTDMVMSCLKSSVQKSITNKKGND